jgi:Antirestriction protein
LLEFPTYHAVLAVKCDGPKPPSHLTACARGGRGIAGNPAPNLGNAHMNSHTPDLISSITARVVPDDERMQTLPRHFGRHMVTFENAVYYFMRKLCSQYGGGYWRFYDLSNCGFYMAPAVEGPILLSVEGNGFDGEMTADAAGVTVCLFAYSHLSFQQAGEVFAQHFHRLSDFALEHAEVGVIYSAID